MCGPRKVHQQRFPGRWTKSPQWPKVAPIYGSFFMDRLKSMVIEDLFNPWPDCHFWKHWSINRQAVSENSVSISRRDPTKNAWFVLLNANTRLGPLDSYKTVIKLPFHTSPFTCVAMQQDENPIIRHAMEYFVSHILLSLQGYNGNE